MKSNRVILIRHGKSEANFDRNILAKKPDYAIELIEEGIQQAYECGQKLLNDYVIENNYYSNTAYYVSPYWRTRQTYREIVKSIPYVKYYEDPRLREQEWGTTFDLLDADIEKVRASYGHFYYRFPGGESCSDLYDRMSGFLDTLYRDFEKDNHPDNTIIISHGMAIRVFLMRFFHLSVEEFELLANPKNCQYIVLELEETGKYRIKYGTELSKYANRDHPYQFDWSK